MAECYNPIYLKKQKIHVSCGKCLNCISNKKKEYGLRMMHESFMDKSLVSYFATLTYRDSDIPFSKQGKPTILKEHAKKYIRSLKRQCDYMQGKFKYFIAGEYGDNTLRPHYHVIILTNRPMLTQIKETWQYGNVDAQLSFNYKSISYTVGYANKKIGFKEFKNQEEPFHKFSRGIGGEWIHEAIAKKKVDERKYYIENQVITSKLPDYYKKILRDHIMECNKKMEIIGHELKKMHTLKLTTSRFNYFKNKLSKEEILSEFGIKKKEHYEYDIEISGTKNKYLHLKEMKPKYEYHYYKNGKKIEDLETIYYAELKWKNFKKLIEENLKDKHWIEDYYYLKTKYKAWKNKKEKTDWYKIMSELKEKDEDFSLFEYASKVEKFDEDIKLFAELRRKKLKDEAIKKYYMKQKNRDIIKIA